MYQRFALIWPAMCLVSMGAHVFVAQSVPSALGIGVTAILAAPLAAIAARFDHRLLSSALMLLIQVLAHTSLSIPVASFAPQLAAHSGGHGDHLHGAQPVTVVEVGSLSNYVVDSGHGVATHSGASLAMLAGHLAAAAILTIVVARVDGFLNQLARFFGVLLGLAKPVPVGAVSFLRFAHSVDTGRVQWLGGCKSSRGPPASFSL